MGIDRRQLVVSAITIAMHLLAVACVVNLLFSRSVLEDKPHQDSVLVRLYSSSQEIPPPLERSHGLSKASSTIRETYSSNDKTDVESILPTIFYGSKEIDKQALPLTEPDAEILTGIPNNTGLPIRVRLYIDQYGGVLSVQPLQNQPDDAPIVEKIIIMLKKTVFMPAMRSGNAVGSYQDLEFNITTVGPLQHK